MQAKKWVITVLVAVMTISLIYGAMNVLIDPFGMFGDPVISWDSYNYTKNPKTAKIEYLNRNHEMYDSYIIGGSTSSSYSVEKLNEYMNASFYNPFNYGCDIKDVEKTVNYVIESYDVKNIVLPIGLREMVTFDVESDAYTDNLHAEVEGESIASFKAKYLFANYMYSFEKLEALEKDSYFQKPFDVFDVSTGAYDKRTRDIEHIQGMNLYLASNHEFIDYIDAPAYLPFSDEALESIGQIRNVCDENKVNLILIFSPEYDDEWIRYDESTIREFMVRLSAVTDFWDFSISSISSDERFFYDPTHIRNAFGDMVLARIFDDGSIYIPDHLGVYVPKDVDQDFNFSFDRYPVLEAASQEHFYDLDSGRVSENPDEETRRSIEVPILLYHHIADEGSPSAVISKEMFETHMKAVSEHGYETISFQELTDYVNKGNHLPDKPIMITFDDGYLSNYTDAYPILKKYNMKAAIFAIGVSVGKDEYKDTGKPIIPHFSYEEAKEMIDSGLIEVQSHSYDFHQYEPYETDGNFRYGVLRRDDESEDDYIKTFKEDFEMSVKGFETIDVESYVYAYPLGAYTQETEVLLSEMGVKVTLSTNKANNEVIRGLPQSLYAMNRWTVSADTTVEELFHMIEGNEE